MSSISESARTGQSSNNYGKFCQGRMWSLTKHRNKQIFKKKNLRNCLLNYLLIRTVTKWAKVCLFKHC